MTASGSPTSPPASRPGGTTARSGRWAQSTTRRVLLVAGIVAFAGFWTWALFFASKESVNKIGDETWSARAEEICAAYDIQIRELDDRADPDLAVRADLVEESTDLLSAMLDEVVAVEPTDAKGQGIVPEWEADYRTLLDDRYRYAEVLRGGENVPFTETAVNGVPITERIETFTVDNAMESCAPPRGSIV